MKNNMSSFEILSKDIDRYDVLSREQEKALFIKVRKGDRSARDLIFCSNLRFVLRIARKYVNDSMPIEDLFQIGCLGLMTAIDRFDVESDNKLITYAQFWIKQSIQRALPEQARCVKLPANKKRLYDDKKYKSRSIYENASTKDTDFMLADTLVDDKYLSPEEHAMLLSDKMQIAGYMKHLTKKERAIVEMRYGLYDGEPKTLNDIGIEFGITREGVRHIEKSALRKLRMVANAC